MGLNRFRIQVAEDLVDAGDDPHRPTAGPAGLNVDTEHPLQTLRQIPDNQRV